VLQGTVLAAPSKSAANNEEASWPPVLAPARLVAMRYGSLPASSDRSDKVQQQRSAARLVTAGENGCFLIYLSSLFASI